jgi:hypothetical protein
LIASEGLEDYSAQGFNSIIRTRPSGLDFGLLSQD